MQLSWTLTEVRVMPGRLPQRAKVPEYRRLVPPILCRVAKILSIVGAMGTDIIVIGTDKAGSFPVKLNYKRQWEKYPASGMQFELIAE